MKFKYTGEDNSFCIELLAYKLLPRDKYLFKGDIIEVPDNNKVVINAIDASGVFQRVNNNKSIKKVDKKEKE